MKYNYSQAYNLPRGFAFFIDIALLSIPIELLNDNYLITHAGNILLITLLYVFYSFIESRYNTLGKRLFYYKVLCVDLSKPSFQKILLRNLLKLPFFLIFGFFYFIPIFWIIIIGMSIFGVDFKAIEVNSMRFAYDYWLDTNVLHVTPKHLIKSSNTPLEAPITPIKKSYKSFSLSRFYFDKDITIKDLNIFKMNKLRYEEIIFISVAAGIVVSVLLGSIFKNVKYYTVHEGVKIYLDEDRGFKSYDFNYIIAIISFILVSGVSYFSLKSKRNEN